MKIILFIIVIFASLSYIVTADTTFFETEDDAFIMTSISKVQAITSAATKKNIEYTKGCNRELEITSPSEIYVNKRETKKLSITVKNKGNCILSDINVSLTTINDWKVESFLIPKLRKNENKTIELSIMPSSSADDKYTVNITADTKEKENHKELIIIINKEETKTLLTGEIKNTLVEEKNLNKTAESPVNKYLFITLILVLALILFVYAKKSKLNLNP